MSFEFLDKKGIAKTASFLGLVIILALFGRKLNWFAGKTSENQPPSVLCSSHVSCIFKGELKKNESLYLSLLEKGLSHGLIYQLTSALKDKFNLKRSLPGDRYTLATTPDSVIFFEYQKGMQEKCKVIREDGELRATVEPLKFNCTIKSTQGEIKSSLWESMIDLCGSPELIMKFTEVFEWQIDFLTEPRNGDRFRLIFEEYHKDGDFIRYGDILAAEYSSDSQVHQVVLYQSPDGRKDYFEPSGKSSKRAFLKSPLNYRRISSRFSYRRFHPIFKRYQPHLGVDYAAPVGTPVVASGDGTVVYAGWKRGFGRIVEIRHNNGFVTSYGHLSRFARGIRRGVKVKQKDLIGYVGNTGASTGPHLDYRVKANGRYVNPLRMVAPPVNPVKEEHMADFQKHRDNYLYALDLLTYQESFAFTRQRP